MMKRIVVGSLILILFLCGFILTQHQVAKAQDEGEDPEEETTPAPLEYFGVRECGDCHRQHRNNAAYSPHTLALSDEPEQILASFDSGEDLRTVTFPGEDSPRPFTADDIAYVMGAGRYVQRYVYATEDGGYRVFPAEWNTVDHIWQPFGTEPETWLEDESYNWLTQCAGCHTTGLNVETGEWVDDGVQCEACHGPGSAHVNLADELPRRPEEEDILALRAAIVVTADAQVCGQCHSQGEDSIHRFPTSYHPGDDLEDDYDLVSERDDDFWWASGHGKASNMQFNEWMDTDHAFSFDDLPRSATDECLTCHSADYRLAERMIRVYDDGDKDDPAPEAATLDNAEFGVTCIACHDPHTVNPDAENDEDLSVDFFLVDEPYNLCVSCHTYTDITPELHHPVQQMFEGTTLIESVPGVPSAHFSAEEGPRCDTCHMTRLPVDSFTLATHTWEVVSPTETEEGQPDSCTQCHSDGVTPVDMKSIIDGVQDITSTRLSAAADRLDTIEEPATDDANRALYDQVVNAINFVRRDGSTGVHNYAYADKLLSFAETSLTELGAEVPEIAEVSTTEASTEETPEVTATPDEAEPIVVEESDEGEEIESGASSITYIIMGATLLLLLVSAFAFFRSSSKTKEA